ncbi:glycosyltransferase family 39 protein [bacterium]|nr:glycosyltransferase family 39 protein [bacterium]
MAMRRETTVAVAVLLLVAVFYVASAPGTLFVKPDTAVYMSVARSLARGDGYAYNGARLGKYPPVFPLMLSAVYRTAGENVRAMQIVVALCGVGAIAMAWLLVRARSGARMAMAVLVLTATCTWFQSHSSAYVLAGAPYALFSIAALWLTERAVRAEGFAVWRWLGVAAVGVVAIATHVTGVALIPALVWAALFTRGQTHTARRRLVAAALVGAICTAAALFWILSNQAVEGTAGYSRHIETVVPDDLGGFVTLARLRLTESVSAVLSRSHKQVRWSLALGVIVLFLLPGLVKAFREHRSATEVYTCAYIGLLLVAGGEGGHERYMVPIVPLLFYYGCLSAPIVCGWAARLARSQSPEKAARIAAVVLAMAVTGHAVVNRIRCKRGASAFRADSQAEAVEERAAWEAMGQWVAADVPADAPLYVGAGGTVAIAHYFTERRIIPCIGVDPVVADVVRHMAKSDAGFLLADHRKWSEPRLAPVLAEFPDCFTLLHENEACALYRIHKDRLGAVDKTLNGGDPE